MKRCSDPCTCGGISSPAPGGALKREKRFWYLVDYEFKDGEWIYTDTVDWELLVPLPDGSEESKRKHWECGLAHGKGGKMDLPDGEWSSSGKICMGILQIETLAWASLWFATLATPFRTAAFLLDSFHFCMLPFLDMNRNIKLECRTLPRAFSGVGRFSFPVKQTICCLNMLLHHYRVPVPSTLGKKFQASLECLQLKVGVNVNPLKVSYDIYGSLATKCWVKTLWERLWVYRFQVTMAIRTSHFLARRVPSWWTFFDRQAGRGRSFVVSTEYACIFKCLLCRTLF
jgi:hypothetical protein